MRSFPLLTSVLLTWALSAPLGAQEAGRHVIVFEVGTGAEAMEAVVQEAGGEVVRLIPDLALAIAVGEGPAFEENLVAAPAVLGAQVDRHLSIHTSLATGTPDYTPFNISEAGVLESLPAAAPGLESLADTEEFFPPWDGDFPIGPPVTFDDMVNAPVYVSGLQWELPVMQAEEAWAAGGLGDPRVTIAIVSSGVDYTHPELLGRVDLERSRNFVPEDAAMVQELFPGAHPIADLGVHGTYVAGGMVCTGFRLACVAPNTSLVGVKVLNNEEKGFLGDYVTGIHYAASIGADLIVVPERWGPRRWSVAEDRVEILTWWRAFLFAQVKGSLVLAPTWPTERFGLGIDADADGDQVLLPAQAGALAVAATGTEDQWAGVSSFGFSLVDISAPGGQVDLDTGVPPTDIFAFSIGPCSSFTQEPERGLPEFCNKNSPPTYFLSAGVRPAVGRAAAVAALVEARWGGARRGWFIRHKLKRTVDDVQEPGRDAKSGHGRVNALRAWTE